MPGGNGAGDGNCVSTVGINFRHAATFERIKGRPCWCPTCTVQGLDSLSLTLEDCEAVSSNSRLRGLNHGQHGRSRYRCIESGTTRIQDFQCRRSS
ncbi:hypothetical protein D3C76_529030 [compost metagenome]